MAQAFRAGDTVRWRSHGGYACGQVLEKITADTVSGGRTVRASSEKPQYRVRSDKNGGEAVHKLEALEKV